MTTPCFHCGEPVLTGDTFSVEINQEQQIMCCPGCEAVASTIIDSGLLSYYQFRTTTANKLDLIPENLNKLSLYDNPDIQADFVNTSEGESDILLSIDGVSCAACAWLIERRLSSLDGVISIQVNTTTHRANLRWHSEKIRLSQLISEIHRIGYHAAPFEADEQERQYHLTMKHYLYRLGIAGIATMQVMMLALAMYFEIFGDMDEAFKQYFRWISLLFATPVLLYSAAPFYLNAWKSLRAKSLVMDVPVSIALLFAYFASFYATLTGKGEVFFESIAMFTFFLLAGRFLEIRARRTAAAVSANLLKLIPKLARLTNGEQVPVNTLTLDQHVSVLPGDTIPADGIILKGKTSVDESMLTGESLPVSRKAGEQVYAGTVNVEGNIEICVNAEKQHSLITRIVQLQDKAQSSKPKVAEMADKVARYFIASILVISALTYAYWSQYNPDEAFWIMLSVLVATCPCALSLATPTALTCATSAFSQIGLLIRRSHALETLTKINHIVIDKTGTLTQGHVTITDVKTFHEYTKDDILAIAAALEQYSTHPIANAFHLYSPIQGVTEVENVIGEGIKGKYNNAEWRIGKMTFALKQPQCFTDTSHQIWLSKEGKAIASFRLSDPVRENSAQVIKQFQQANVNITMLTGDQSKTSHEVSQQLGIKTCVAGVSPQGKLDYLRGLPKKDIILMIGDGVNDVPTLAGAHVSVAMGGGTDVAKSAADIILLGDDLSKLLLAKRLSALTKRIIRQNLTWSLGYNLVILPLAVMGYVAPYIAVAGMSASSVIVVTNSLRLFNKNIINKIKED